MAHRHRKTAQAVFTGLEAQEPRRMVEQSILSPRERQIAQTYASGASYQDIAEALCLAPSTVRTHLATVYRKLQVSSKLELATRLNGHGPEPRSESELSAIISELALSLEEAINREKALSEVLRIIGSCQGDLDVVMPRVLNYTLEMCDAEFGILFDYLGNSRFRAGFALGIPETFQEWLDDNGTFTVSPQTGLGRMIAHRQVVNIIDVKSEAIYRSNDPLRFATADLGGARSFAAIPMLAAESLVGAFCIYRQTVRPFSKDTLRLAGGFADQSVIALENARLISLVRTAET